MIKYGLEFIARNGVKSIFVNEEEWYSRLNDVVSIHETHHIVNEKLLIGLMDKRDAHHKLYNIMDIANEDLVMLFSIGSHNNDAVDETYDVIKKISSIVELIPIWCDAAGYIALIDKNLPIEKLDRVGDMILSGSSGEVYYDYYAEHNKIGTMIKNEGRIHLWWD